MFKDRTGLLYLNYKSCSPLLGNRLFSAREVPDLVGDAVEVDGWFVRGLGPALGMRHLRTDAKTIDGYVHLFGLVSGGMLAVLGVAVVAGLALYGFQWNTSVSS